MVDDEIDITTTLRRGLESHGYAVDTFNQPKDALNQYANQYDIAIVDIRMPKMNGFDLARELWRKNDKLQICFLSSFDINANEAKVTMPNLKSDCFITKPMLPSDLARHIESHFVTN